MNAYFDFLRQSAPWLGAGALLAFLSSFGQTFFISIFAADIQRTFDLTHGEWGLIYTIGTTVSAAVMIWTGPLADRFRVRNIGAAVLVCLALACLFMAANPLALLLPVVIFALRLTGQGMTSHIAVVAMARWFVARRGRALAIATLGFSVGEAILPLIFVALMVSIDWRILWCVAAVIALAGVPLLALLLRTERTPAAMLKETSSTGMGNRHWTRPEALAHPLFWFMVPTLLGPSAFVTALFFHQVHFADIKGWTHLNFVALFPFYTLTAVGSVFLSGWALDRYGTGRLIPYFQIPLLLAFLVFAFANSLLAALFAFGLLGLATGANAALPSAFWAEYYGTRHIGAIKAMATSLMVFGSAIGPGLTGQLIDAGIGLEQQFIGAAAYFLVACFFAWFGLRQTRISAPV